VPDVRALYANRSEPEDLHLRVPSRDAAARGDGQRKSADFAEVNAKGLTHEPSRPVSANSPVPEKIQARWDEIHAELQRRLEALWDGKAPAFKLTAVIHGEGGIPRRMVLEENGRRQPERA
jgi:hypothetical protein